MIWKDFIMLNKENINLFANIKSNEFLWGIVLYNILSLWNSKKILLQAIESILYGNWHSTIYSFLNIYYLIKILINKLVFEK